jgi:DNA-binding MarR family transcriptional regulator
MTPDILNLANEVRLLFHQLVESGEALHSGEPITMGMRAVLEYLLHNGASTVPDIARNRHVTRQHIQILVNDLIEHDAVELADNPAHKRSSLVTLTRAGKQGIQRMKKREVRFFDDLDLEVSQSELRRAAKTLQSLRESLGERS